MTRAAIALVLVHLVVLLGHDRAHESLGVGLDTWQTVYVYTVIVPAPFVALGLLWRWPRGGFGLLFASMLGALLFGAYHHYVAISPDHVAHLPAGEAQGLFRSTAAVMVVTELIGTAVGLAGLLGSAPTRPGPEAA